MVMKNWTAICDFMRKFAKRSDELEYQDSVKYIILLDGLGWNESQIKEQVSIQLGSTKRIVPDIIVEKDKQNRFVIEVKKPGHRKNQKNVEQLVSYMKQLETPVGIYIGDELEVYYRTIGDGSHATLLMSLHFNDSDSEGADFIKLFAENSFSIENIVNYKKEREAQKAMHDNVERLVKEIASTEFHTELRDIIKAHLIKKGETGNVIEKALSKIDISLKTKAESTSTKQAVTAPISNYSSKNTRKRGHNTDYARHYAYKLIKQIIRKNPSWSFGQLYAVFDQKNYIEDITRVKDTTRWFIDEDDIVTIADGTRVVISNQWGYYGNYKSKMDRLESIAEEYGIETDSHRGL